MFLINIVDEGSNFLKWHVERVFRFLIDIVNEGSNLLKWLILLLVSNEYRSKYVVYRDGAFVFGLLFIFVNVTTFSVDLYLLDVDFLCIS